MQRLVLVQFQHLIVYQCYFGPNLCQFDRYDCVDDLFHGYHYDHDVNDPIKTTKSKTSISILLFIKSENSFLVAVKMFKLIQTFVRRGERDRRLYRSRDRDGERERLRDLEYERERERRLLRLLLTKSS